MVLERKKNESLDGPDVNFATEFNDHFRDNSCANYIDKYRSHGKKNKREKETTRKRERERDVYAPRLFSTGPGAISVRSSESRTDVSDGFRRKSPRRKNDLRSNAVREGKSSRGGAAGIGLMHRAKPVGREL